MSNNKKWDMVQLQNTNFSRNEEHHTWINIFSISLTTTAILLIALFTTGKFPHKVPGIIICTFGFIISIVFFHIQNRALITMKGHEKTIKEIESDAGLGDSTKNLNESELVGARTLMKTFAAILIIGWLAGIILFIILA